jgi:RNA polymerase sigma-70 factor (ECF subfamily)
MMIDAIKKGDSLAFEQAYFIYRQKLLAYFFKKTNSQEDAKDLLQTTFCKLWQYRKSLNEEYLLEQQLFYIARTVFIDYLRKENKLHKIRTSVKLKIRENQSAENAYEFDVQAQLQNMLADMPALRKKVFELHKIQGYSYKEIATILAIPVKSVDNNLTKALKHLRNIELLFIIISAIVLH